MAESDIVLRMVSSTDSNADMRSFRVYQVIENAAEELELYRFLHPMTGHQTGTTTYHRKNLSTVIFETAGQIEWFSPSNATVWFGVDEVPVKDLRKIKNSSQSRRFKVTGTEYKWKIAENGNDLFCVDSKDKHVAAWSADERLLRVAPRCVNILDRVIVTCFLNLWFKRLGRW
ncbi:hypothetical protein HYDPIDRAFT_104967 [Hydnomerulius pinastri MD-312]|nr:hypothetical protein HYDPIDRAFT_104967 [Hydnomerulius pinastri MD-312]